MSLPEFNLNEYVGAGGAVALFLLIWKIVATPMFRLIRPQAANDLAEIKSSIQAIRKEMHDDRGTAAKEMDNRRAAENKLFDQFGNLAQRVARIEGEHSAGGT